MLINMLTLSMIMMTKIADDDTDDYNDNDIID